MMLENICHVLIISYLLIAAYIDHKTKFVYRIGSIFFICIAIILFGGSVDFTSPITFERIFSILLASSAVIMQGKAKLMGWGDVLTYIGVFIYLASWEYDHLSLELMAIYMLLANLLFLLFNIRNLDWKKKKFKEEAAFLPGMAGALLLLMLYFHFCKGQNP